MKIICKECNKEIDDSKKQCPNCGYKNKINLSLYKNGSLNDYCIKCGEHLNKKDIYCTKCGYKNNRSNSVNILKLIKTIFLRNKFKFIIVIVLLFVSFILIKDNMDFNEDIILAEKYYDEGKYYEVGKIVDKYSWHKNNEFVKKYNYVKYLLNDYSFADSSYRDDDFKLKWLLNGYNDCLQKETKNNQEKEWVNEVKQQYYIAINKIVNLSTDEIKKICVLNGDELEDKIDSLLKDVKKSKACEKNNIKVIHYDKYGYHIDITLKNNNGCTWNIKSYSKVRVYFTDHSYEDVYLKTNINLYSDDTYNFKECYLGSENEYKKVSSVTFVD